ncbi:MAG: hypothetical protein LBL86_05740 [Coriobacteriales bacterium]|jgi:hypothetical protein|nr:hypothetical protein [Coriobacteriales bacterium]
MQETKAYLDVLPQDILDRYQVMETGSAAKILQAVCGDEFDDIISVMRSFVLTSRLLLTPGGNRGPIPVTIDGMLDELGWIEARVDIEKKTYFFSGHSASISAEDEPAKYEENLISRTYQRGYSIDNVKGRLAADVEWNPKDGNLDRDFSAYRAWFDEGIIVAAILITRLHESTKELTRSIWQHYLTEHPEHAQDKQPVDLSTTTTANYEKAVHRIVRGDLGTCPILVFGIGERAWDGEPWDGKIMQWDKNLQKLSPVDYIPKKQNYSYTTFNLSD